MKERAHSGVIRPAIPITSGHGAAAAQAIAEAVSRASMRFVAVKSAGQQSQAMILKIRDLLQGQMVQTINALRRHLAEHGIMVPQGPSNVPKLEAALDDPGLALPEIVIEERGLYPESRRTRIFC